MINCQKIKDGDKMANTDGQIVLGLDIPKTVTQINADIKKLQNQLKQIKATGALDTSSMVKKINAQIAALQSQLKAIDINANVNISDAQKVGQTIADINLRLKETESTMHGMGKLGLSWTDKIKQTWKKFDNLGFASGTMTTLVNQLRKMPKKYMRLIPL